MQAIEVRAFGGPEVLRLAEVARPEPGPGQVLVRLLAAGVNPVETYIRSGAYDPLPALPYTPGGDGAGLVAELGEGVHGLAPGARVYVTGSPTYAEFAVCPAANVHPLPDALSFAQGAAVGIPCGTALRALELARARPGDLVLVHGGSGGVGTAAVQICRSLGQDVVATASTKAGRALLESLGAVAVGHGEYAAARSAFGGRGFDVILEMAAERNLGRDLPELAPGGRIVVIGSRGGVELNPRDLMRAGGSVQGMLLGRTPPEEMRRLHLWLGAALRGGALRPVVGRTLPLEEAAQAHAAVLESGAMGNVVLEIGQASRPA